VNVPPVTGIKETSPIVLEKVWRSSWAYYLSYVSCGGLGASSCICSVLFRWQHSEWEWGYCKWNGTYISGSEIPFALDAKFYGYARELNGGFGLHGGGDWGWEVRSLRISLVVGICRIEIEENRVAS